MSKAKDRVRLHAINRIVDKLWMLDNARINSIEQAIDSILANDLEKLKAANAMFADILGNAKADYVASVLRLTEPSAEGFQLPPMAMIEVSQGVIDKLDIEPMLCLFGKPLTFQGKSPSNDLCFVPISRLVAWREAGATPVWQSPQ